MIRGFLVDICAKSRSPVVSVGFWKVTFWSAGSVLILTVVGIFKGRVNFQARISSAKGQENKFWSWIMCIVGFKRTCRLSKCVGRQNCFFRCRQPVTLRPTLNKSNLWKLSPSIFLLVYFEMFYFEMRILWIASSCGIDAESPVC